jgi:hypothetical protein
MLGKDNWCDSTIDVKDTTKDKIIVKLQFVFV